MLVMDFVPSKRGSLEAFLLKLSAYMVGRSIEVCYLFSGECPDWFRAEVAAGTLLLASRGNPIGRGNYLSTIRAILRLRPSVLDFWFVSMFSWRTLLLTRLPYVERSIFSDHSSAAGSVKRGWRLVIGRWRGSLASLWYHRITSVSEYNQRRNIERNHIWPEKTLVIYNGIIERMESADCHGGSEEPVGSYFLFAGQLIREKGVFTLLRAYAKLVHERCGEAGRLMIVGQGRDGDEMRRLACELGIQDNTVFMGIRNDVQNLMSKARAVVIPSEWPEAFGYTVAEAMLTGNSLITSDAGAIPEIVGDTGLVFPSGNVDELANCMRYVLKPENAAALCERAEYARARCRKKFSIERMLSDYSKLYTGE